MTVSSLSRSRRVGHIGALSSSADDHRRGGHLSIVKASGSLDLQSLHLFLIDNLGLAFGNFNTHMLTTVMTCDCPPLCCHLSEIVIFVI